MTSLSRPQVSPDDYSAVLAEVDDFYAAMIRLDDTHAAFRAVSNAPGPVDELAFARAEAAFLAARSEWRRLLSEKVGMDATSIERRVGL